MSETVSPWWDARRLAGFRFSAADAVIVVLCAAVTWGLWRLIGSFALICPVVLGHFFLFCNVFRVGNRAEIIWGLVFVVNVAAWFVCEALTWPRVIAVQSPVTLVVIVWALFRNDYHGLGYFRIRKRRKRESEGKQ